MISLFIKSYKYRFKELLLYFLSTICLFFVSASLFANTINTSTSINDAYKSYNYEQCYIFNYETEIEDELIYPDTTIEFFADYNMAQKITATSVMKKGNCHYKNNQFSFDLLTSEECVCVPLNIAKTYNIKTGSNIFALFPHDNILKKMNVVEISSTNFDISDLGAKNNIGLLAIGFNENYVKNISSKYCVFSSEKLDETIGSMPQVLNKVINKIEYIDFSKRLLLAPVLVEIGIVIVSFILFLLLVAFKTHNKVSLLIKKGLAKNTVRKIEFSETFILHTVFCILFYFLINMIFLKTLTFHIVINLFIPVIACALLLLVAKTLILIKWRTLYGIIRI